MKKIKLVLVGLGKKNEACSKKCILNTNEHPGNSEQCQCKWRDRSDFTKMYGNCTILN